MAGYGFVTSVNVFAGKFNRRPRPGRQGRITGASVTSRDI